LKIASKKHDTIALRIFDERENVLPPMGLVKFFDTESGQIRWIDTNNAAVRNNYSLQNKKRENQLINLFNRSGVDAAHINTREPYIKPLMNLFKRRAK